MPAQDNWAKLKRVSGSLASRLAAPREEAGISDVKGRLGWKGAEGRWGRTAFWEQRLCV